MKENRKLLKEVLRDIRHDMTNEEVLNLLADSKISISPKNEKTDRRSGRRRIEKMVGMARIELATFSPPD